MQIDVIGIDFATKSLLLGECKWQENPVSHSTVRELIEEKRAKLFKDLDWDESSWSVSYVFFSRAGFTLKGAEYAREHHIKLVDLQALGDGLSLNE